MSLSTKTRRGLAILWLGLVAVFCTPQPACAGARTFASLTINPASSNIAAGAKVTAAVALGTKASSGSTASGAVVLYVDSISPWESSLSAAIEPNAYTIGTSATNSSILTVATTAGTPANTYVLTVIACTNASAGGNLTAPITSTYTLTVAGGASNAFAMSLAPVSMSVIGGAATNVSAMVSFVNYSATLADTVTNGVRVSPAGSGVTASLNSIYAPITNNPGRTNLVVNIAVAANAMAGAYTVIVSGTNHNFTANLPIAGVASATNTFLVVKPPAHLSIDRFSLSDAILALSGSGGVADGQYVVLASTNSALPLSQWTPLLTNAFDSGGGFNASIGLAGTVNSNAPRQFFALVQNAGLAPAVALPAFSPPAAAYASEPAVTIVSTTGGASIRYTTDGTTPDSSTGTLYTGPVAIPGPVVTNLTGVFSNASGVTMLKAIAYRSGQPDSPVLTGNYQIMVPPPSSSASPLCGIAHVAYRVTSLAAARHFWKDYLGFGEAFLLPNSNTVGVIKINDQQYVELYEGPVAPPQYQIVNYGYQVRDAAAHRLQLASRGVYVPAAVSTNAQGNLSFFSTDPDGHNIEWVQYLTNSLTGQHQGQAMPGTQVFGYIISTGGFTSNSYALNNAFYLTQCGFLPNATSGLDSHLIGLPNSDGFYEHGSYNTLDAPTAGKKSQIDLLNFRGQTIQQSVAILTNRDRSVTIDLHLTSKGRYVGNVYDPDGTRVELDDE